MKKLYPDEQSINLIKKISKTNYYEGNKAHSIEHIQKTILFADILANGEKISEDEKKLLLISAAFHDCGRKLIGGDGNEDHAKPSAKFSGKILKNTKEYGKLSDQDISMIQTAIEYHEYKEYPLGEIDKKQIQKIAEKYNVKSDNFSEVEKISALLKDADALDRFRFAKNGRLKIEYLHSDMAKDEQTIEFAEKINNDISKEILKEIYKVNENQIEANQKNGISPTMQLRNKRIENYKKTTKNEQNIATIEPHIPVENVIKIFSQEKNQDNLVKHNNKNNNFFNMNNIDIDYDDLRRVNDAVYDIFKNKINKDEENER